MGIRLAVVLCLSLAGCAHKKGPCVPPVPPTPTECCESCTPEDIGCGVLVCKPGTGVNCAPCPRFSK